MDVHGVNETKAVNIAMQDPELRDKWNAAKSMKFSPLLTKKAPHGWGGAPDVPPRDSLDDEDDEDDLRREGAHRRPRLRKSLLPFVMARRRQQGGGGGVPR
jgi:hypothetical protein